MSTLIYVYAGHFSQPITYMIRQLQMFVVWSKRVLLTIRNVWRYHRVIRSHTKEKGRQYNGQKKEDKQCSTKYNLEHYRLGYSNRKLQSFEGPVNLPPELDIKCKIDKFDQGIIVISAGQQKNLGLLVRKYRLRAKWSVIMLSDNIS